MGDADSAPRAPARAHRLAWLPCRATTLALDRLVPGRVDRRCRVGVGVQEAVHAQGVLESSWVMATMPGP